MITSIILYILAAVVSIVSYLLGFINYVVPPQINSAFNLFFSYVRIGDGIFPFNQALLAIFTVLTVWGLLYLVKVILFGFSLIPWVGRVVHLPNHHSESVTDSESYNAKGGLTGRTKSRRSGDSY